MKLAGKMMVARDSVAKRKTGTEHQLTSTGLAPYFPRKANKCSVPVLPCRRDYT